MMTNDQINILKELLFDNTWIFLKLVIHTSRIRPKGDARHLELDQCFGDLGWTIIKQSEVIKRMLPDGISIIKLAEDDQEVLLSKYCCFEEIVHCLTKLLIKELGK